jgi:hypothetical protein
LPAVQVAQLGAAPVVPAGHAPSATQLDWFALLELVPAAHSKHFRSVVAVPGSPTKVPGLQVLHATHGVDGF